MARKYWIAIGICAVVAILIVRYFAVGRQTQSRQPQLLAITPQTLPEPMLPTDWGRPSTGELARLSDPRVTQFWDRGHLIAGQIEKGANGRHPACCSRHGAWWDVIAAYPPGAQWMGTAPAPEILNGTIVRTAPQLQDQLEHHS